MSENKAIEDNQEIIENLRKETIKKITEEFKSQIQDAKSQIQDMNEKISQKQKEVGELENKKKEIKNETDSLMIKIENHKNNLKKIENSQTQMEIKNEERQKELEKIDIKISEKSKKIAELENLELEIHKKEFDFNKIQENIKNEKTKLDEAFSRLKKINEEYEEKSSIIEKAHSAQDEFLEKEKKLVRKENYISTREKEFEKNHEKMRKEAGESYISMIENYKEQLEERVVFIKELEEDKFSLERKLNKIENSDYDTITEENRRLESKIKNLENRISDTEKEEQEKIRDLENERKDLLKKLSEAAEEKRRLETDLAELQGSKMEIEKFQFRYKSSEDLVEELYSEVKRKEEEIEKLKNKQLNREEKIQSIRNPYEELEKYKDIRDTVELSETEWLDRIKRKIEEENFRFSDRLIYAFHTALKTADWSPITVLAGVSGTGKSELPRLYSQYGGLIFLPLAVQPDWDSPQSLFGYYNSLEGKFNSTNLLKLLYQLQPEGEKGEILPLNKYMSLVLLDEMNLAHIELYFSELLSGLERLRSRESVGIDINISEDNPLTIKLERNILWTGTMNQDETTKSLSDKVIDRGNVLSFPRPVRLASRREIIRTSEKIDRRELLKKETWKNWKAEKADEKLEMKLEEYREILENISEYLEISGRAIGHRVWQAVENYIMNHPCVINESDENSRKKWIQIAFEDALVHKVMPKLKDLETSGDIKEKCLVKIKELIAHHAEGILEDFEIAMENPYGVFGWRSSKYLDINLKQEQES
ncbi:MAG: hypothetical protein ACRCTS_03710 [Fusobacteriaceae bacterium]